MEDLPIPQHTHPIALIPDIPIPDGRYDAIWDDDEVSLCAASRSNPEGPIRYQTFEISRMSEFGIPVAVRVNVKSGHGFVWLEES